MRLVAGLPPLRLGFDLRSVHVRFVVDKVTLGQVFLRILRLTPVIIIPPVLHTHLDVALFRRTNGRGAGTFHKAMLFGKSGNNGYRSTFTF